MNLNTAAASSLQIPNILPYSQSPALPPTLHQQSWGSLTSSMLPLTQKCCIHYLFLFLVLQHRENKNLFLITPVYFFWPEAAPLSQQEIKA